MPAADDIAEYLEDQSLGTVGTDIFVGQLPDDPDNAICVAQTAGKPPDYLGAQEYAGIQIRVRNTDHDTGYALANNILDLLHGAHSLTLETRPYHRIDAQGSVSGPQIDPNDSEGRVEFTLNFIVFKDIE